MVVLAAIGRFFKKIWDWIKQTAWIQPLLIVGVIFGVIFSIRPIKDAIDAANKKANAVETYYYASNHFYSLSGGAESAADKLSYKIAEKMDDGNANVDYGTGTDKFFVAFVSKAETSTALKDGFQILENKMNATGESYFVTDDKKPFKLVTIFTDEETSDTEDGKSAFSKYLIRHSDLFELAGTRVDKYDYCFKGHLDKDRLEKLAMGEPEAFNSTVIMLVESNITQELAGRQYKAGVTEIIFDVEGTEADDKAKTLLDCWNHDGKFNKDSN